MKINTKITKQGLIGMILGMALLLCAPVIAAQDISGSDDYKPENRAIADWKNAAQNQVTFAAFQSISTSGALDWAAFTIGDEQFLAVANTFDDTTANIDSKIYRWDGAQFIEFQSIPTQGAHDWEHFTIGVEHYLAIANWADDMTHNINSTIYRWDGAHFVIFQSIPTHGAEDWEFFTIGSEHYLAIANAHNDVTRNVNSIIYKWDGTQFTEHQAILTQGNYEWEFFSIDDQHYLAAAGHYNDTTYNFDSKIYHWDGSQFVEFQSIPTHGAIEWESFTIGDDHFLAVANRYNGTSYDILSKVYRWNGSAFVEFQSIPTHGATDWQHFRLGEEHYLVVANAANGVTHSIDSILYRWDGAGFVEFQAIPTGGAHDWEFFTIASVPYLMVANAQGDSSQNMDSTLYKASSTTTVDWKFVEFQSIPTSGAMNWEFFTIGDKHFLAEASVRDDAGYNLNSHIYQWDGNRFVEFQSIPTSGARKWTFFTIGSERFLAVGNYYNGSTHNLNSKIYRWDGVAFVEYQSIPTHGGAAWEFFTIDDTSYLAIANCSDDWNKSIHSIIYRWDGAQFVEFQSILTHCAIRWEFFSIDNTPYLAIANSQDDSGSYEIDSKIYQWNGSNFVEYQSIPTQRARDWEFFTIDNAHYLAVANAQNNATPEVDSKIYRWDGAYFVEFQSIPTQAADKWKFFTLDGDAYLAVANIHSDSSYWINSTIYQWTGCQFAEFQSISTQGGSDMEFFTIGNETYLAVANQYDNSSYNIDSKIYKRAPLAPACPANQLTTNHTVPLERALRMALSPDGDRLYVVQSAYTLPGDPRSNVVVVDTSTQATLATIPLGFGLPDGIALAPDGSRAYVAVSKAGNSITSPGDSRIDILNTSTYTVVGTIPIPGVSTNGPIGIVLSPSGDYAYVSDRGNDKVHVIDVNQNTLIKSIAIEGGSPLAVPIGLDITPDGSRVYVANRANSTLSVIETTSHTLAATLQLSLGPSNSTTGVALAPDGQRAYITYRNNGSIAVVDIQPGSPTYHQEIAVIATSSSDLGYIRLTPDGYHAFVDSRNTNEMLVIDTDPDSPYFHTQIHAVPVGDNPTDVVIPSSSTVAAYASNGGGSISVIGCPSAPESNLLAMYMLAFDNDPLSPLNLDPYFQETLQAIADATLGRPEVTAVVLADRGGRQHDAAYVIQQGIVANASADFPDMPVEVDATDSQTLGHFIQWARATYPATRTTFSFIGHNMPLPPDTDLSHFFGGGSPQQSNPNTPFPLPARTGAHPTLTDQQPAGLLSPHDLAEALRLGSDDGAHPLDVVDMAFCFGLSLENVYPLRAYAQAVTGSPNYLYFEPEFAYQALLAAQADLSAEAMAVAIVQAYHNTLPDDGHPSILAALDTDQLIPLKQAWDAVSLFLWQGLDDPGLRDQYKAGLAQAYTDSHKYDCTFCQPQDWELASPDALVDVGHFAGQLRQQFGELSEVGIAAGDAIGALNLAVITRTTQNGSPWFAAPLTPTWNFDGNAGLSLYADLAGRSQDGWIALNSISHWYTQTVSADNPHPYTFVMSATYGPSWADVFAHFWAGTHNITTETCLPYFPPISESGELAAQQVLFPIPGWVRVGSPVSISVVLSTAQAIHNPLVAITVTQDSSTVFTDVVGAGYLPGGVHQINASHVWTPTVIGPFQITFSVDTDNRIVESNEADNTASMSSTVLVASPWPRPIITATTFGQQQFITSSSILLSLAQSPASAPEPGAFVTRLVIDIYQYQPGQNPGVNLPVKVGQRTFDSIRLPQAALAVDLATTVTAGPVVLHIWPRSDGGGLGYPAIVAFNYTPPDTAIEGNQDHYYKFRAAADDQITLQLELASGDAAMHVWEPGNYWSAQAITGSGTLLISPSLAGEYVIGIHGLLDGTRYTLEARRGNSASLYLPLKANTYKLLSTLVGIPRARPAFIAPIPAAPTQQTTHRVYLPLVMR